MNKKALSLAICLAMAIPTASNALSLGDIESKSSLNQPFQGRINLLQTNPAEVQKLRVRVASPEVFNRVGIDRPAFLNSIRFKTAVQNGRPVILVSSNQPINEPFLNFLLEVSWPNGQLLKEYTVLLDPPVLLRPNTAIASNNAGVRAEPTAQGRINRAPQPTPQQLQAQRQRQAQQQQRQRQAQQQRRAQQQRQAQQAQRQAQGLTQFERQAQQVLQGQTARRVAAAPTRSTSRTPSNNYRVRKGDTLSKIASRLAINGIRKDQMMVALFEKNRRAFSQGNMNNLKAGAMIARPSVQEARSLNARQAKAEIIAQARAWKANRTQLASNGSNKSSKSNPARIEVLGNSNNASSSSSNGNSAAVADLNKQVALLTESLTTKQQESTELRSRVSELESLLRKKNRLIALKSEQLAGLQSGLSANNPQGAQQNNDAAVTSMGSEIQEQVAGELASENGEIVRVTPETAVVDNSQAPEQFTPEPEIEVAQQEPETNAFKSEPESGMDIMGLVTSPVGLAAGLGSLALLGGFAFMRRRKNKNGDAEDFSDLIDSGLNEQEIEEELIETNFDDQQAYEDTNFVESQNQDINTQDEAISTTQTDGDLDDLIQEADVYIVYGLHEQAESEIKRALLTYPDNPALHAKLLENYKASGNAEAFEEATKTFMALESNEKQNYWDEICEWGNTLLPDNKLYDRSALGSIAGAATGAAMVAGTAIAASKADAEDSFSDMSDKVTDTVNDIGAEDLIEDTILDEFDEVDLDTEIDNFDDFDDLDLDSALDMSELEDIKSSDVVSDTIEIADLDDDFEIDLDEDFGSMTIDDKETDSKSDLIIDDAEESIDDAIEDTDFLFDDDSLEDLLNAEIGEDSSDLPEIDLLDDIDLESDVSVTNKSKDVNEAANLNLKIGSEEFDKIMPESNAYKSKASDINAQFDADGDDNLLADFDDNLSFLDLDDDNATDDEVAGDSQIETKIDLAKAYIDMGDIEGARSTLEEVMESGNDDQKRQAEELLHQNG